MSLGVGSSVRVQSDEFQGRVGTVVSRKGSDVFGVSFGWKSDLNVDVWLKGHELVAEQLDSGL